MVRIAYLTEPPCFTPYYYEPLCSSTFHAVMESTYIDVLVPFMKAWHDNTMPHMEYPVEEEGVWLDAPKQPDGTSCGVMVIAQVYAMLKDSFQFSNTAPTADDIAVMRLRIMWMILMQPEVSTVANRIASAIAQTDLELAVTVITR